MNRLHPLLSLLLALPAMSAEPTLPADSLRPMEQTTLGEAIEKYTENAPKGEFVLVVAGAPEQEKEVATADDAAARVQQLMEEGLSRKDAVKQTAKELNLPKNAVYDAALK